MMNYLVYGKDEFSIKAKVKALIANAQVNSSDISRYDGNAPDFNYGDLLEDCNTVNFFSEHRCVVFANPTFLLKEPVCDATSISNMLAYLKDPNPDVDLIMYAYDLNLVEKNIKKICEIFNYKQMTYENYCKIAGDLINQAKLKLNFNVRNLLIDYSNQDLFLLRQNIAKLKLYNGAIDEDVLGHLIDVPFEEDIFKFTNALFAKDMNKALLILKDFYANNVAPQYLIAIIASQLRFLNKVSYLHSCHMTLSQIAELTKSKEFRIVKSLETIKQFHDANFLELLNELSNLDQAIKTSNDLDPNLRLELFIVSLTRR